MDHSSFCGEFTRLISARLPSAVIPDQDPSSIARHGRWHYPSVRDQNAYFFDCGTAYRQYLAGAPLAEIADAAEYGFLQHQWNVSAASAGQEIIGAVPPQWALRLRPASEDPAGDLSPFCLCWDRYLLEPLCRFLLSASLSFQPVRAEDLARLGTDEAGFWERFWRELPQQDPPELGSDLILTGRRGLYGAAVLFYPGLLSRLYGRFSDFRLLLSSPHEAVIFPAAGVPQQDGTGRPGAWILSGAAAEAQGFVPALFQYTVEAGLTPC